MRHRRVDPMGSGALRYELLEVPGVRSGLKGFVGLFQLALLQGSRSGIYAGSAAKRAETA